MEWINRIKNRGLLKKLSIKIPLTNKNYSKSVCLHIEEGVRFNTVRFHCRDLTIGVYSYMHSGQLHMVSKIGRYCSIGERVYIGVDPIGHPVSWLSTHPFQYNDKYLPIDSSLKYESHWDNVEIGHDVWIGQDSIIMKGVKIGNGAIIGARSIVTHDIPDYAIAVGTPAKVIKYRFPSEVIKSLQKYPWWELSAVSLKPISFDNIDKAVEQLSKVYWSKASFNSFKIVIKNEKVCFYGA